MESRTARAASQFSYFCKSELCPLLVNNYIISGAWRDDPRKIPREVGSRHHGCITCMAGCMCRSSAEHRLKIEGLGAQTQTIPPCLPRAARGGTRGLSWLCGVWERESEGRSACACLPMYLCLSVPVPVCLVRSTVPAHPASLCSGRIWSVWSGLVWSDLDWIWDWVCTAPALLQACSSCCTACTQLRVLRRELGGPGQHHLQSRLAIGLGESGLCGGDPAKERPRLTRDPNYTIQMNNDKHIPSMKLGAPRLREEQLRGRLRNMQVGRVDNSQTCTWFCEVCPAASQPIVMA